MNVFDPLMIQSLPSRTAVVFSAARSEPPYGSVMPIAVIISPVQNCGKPTLLLLVGRQLDEIRCGAVVVGVGLVMERIWLFRDFPTVMRGCVAVGGLRG